MPQLLRRSDLSSGQEDPTPSPSPLTLPSLRPVARKIGLALSHTHTQKMPCRGPGGRLSRQLVWWSISRQLKSPNWTPARASRAMAWLSYGRFADYDDDRATGRLLAATADAAARVVGGGGRRGGGGGEQARAKANTSLTQGERGAKWKGLSDAAKQPYLDRAEAVNGFVVGHTLIKRKPRREGGGGGGAVGWAAGPGAGDGCDRIGGDCTVA